MLRFLRWRAWLMPSVPPNGRECKRDCKLVHMLPLTEKYRPTEDVLHSCESRAHGESTTTDGARLAATLFGLGELLRASAPPPRRCLAHAVPSASPAPASSGARSSRREVASAYFPQRHTGASLLRADG